MTSNRVLATMILFVFVTAISWASSTDDLNHVMQMLDRMRTDKGAKAAILSEASAKLGSAPDAPQRLKQVSDILNQVEQMTPETYSSRRHSAAQAILNIVIGQDHAVFDAAQGLDQLRRDPSSKTRIMAEVQQKVSGFPDAKQRVAKVSALLDQVVRLSPQQYAARRMEAAKALADYLR